MVNWISVRLLLAISSIHEFPRRLIDFVLVFTHADLDVYVFMEIPLGMLVYDKRGYWVLKLNKPIYGLKQEIADWFDHLKTGL